eukprot:12136279-Alexandrium_andersonii.AAC.1
MHNHPVLQVPNWQERAIPLVLYGDGARFARKDSLEIAAMAFLMSRGSTWTSKLVSACFVHSAEDGHATWDAIWKVLAWSLEWTFKGQHPPTDHLGQPWAPGSYGAKMAAKGSLSEAGYFGCLLYTSPSPRD